MVIRRPTQKDVARLAGVSISAVSYALNANSAMPLSPETKERVRVAAERLGYVPNRLAASLQARSSRAIGVLLDRSLTIPRYAAIVQALGAGLRTLDHRLTLLEGIEGDVAVADVRGGMLDGLVFIGHDDHDVPTELLTSVVEHAVPFVALDCGQPLGDTPYSTIDFDYARGAADMVRYLAGAGVRHVLYVRPDLSSRAERQREAALNSTLAEYSGMSMSAASDLISESDLLRAEPPDGTRAARLSDAVLGVLRAQPTDPTETAIICAWGTDVEAAFRAAQVHDQRIRVGGLASGTLSVGVWPGLSYSRLPLQAAGEACARLIVRAATGEGSAEHHMLAPVLDAGTVITTEGGAP